ncbi:Dihydroorotase [hydrothermal vent metagenome]|uniref:Dihydroorotase n=1 Tax=hydrothermal vent metagenome TaxID=652676 RepID=A0A1W1D344_9ZZZZ
MVIKNAIICDVNGQTQADIQIQNGIVTQIGKNLDDKEIIDARGKYLLPALVDTNISLKDDILDAKNIKSLSKQALCGGIGTLVLNPTSTPAINNEVVFEYAQNAINHLHGANIKLSINTLQEDLSLSNIAILLKKGAVAPYMSTIAKNNIAIKIAEYTKFYDVTLFCKAEDNSLINNGVMLEGNMSAKLGLAGIPELSEVLHVSRMIEIARYFDIKILFKSIASPKSIALITQAKQDGVQVQCEVSLSHLTSTDEKCEDFNTVAKINPPLATKEDVAQLIQALKNNQIDMLTTLHKENSPVNKEVAFYDAAYGSESITDALALYYTKLVKSNIITMNKLIELVVKNPALTIGYHMGEIQTMQEANFILFDPKHTYEIKNKQSLYFGEKVDGKVTHFITKEKVISL